MANSNYGPAIIQAPTYPPPSYPFGDGERPAPTTFHTSSLLGSTVVIRVAADGRVELFRSLPYDIELNLDSPAEIDAQPTADDETQAAAVVNKAAQQLRDRLALQADSIAELHALLEDARALLDLRKRGVKAVVARIDEELA